MDRASALRRSLVGEALKCVRSFFSSQPNAYVRMWNRLDWRNSHISMCVQTVYDDLSKLRIIKAEDHKGLGDFADELEMCYCQLAEVGQIKSITMNHIDSLSDKLPIHVRENWNVIYPWMIRFIHSQVS